MLHLLAKAEGGPAAVQRTGENSRVETAVLLTSDHVGNTGGGGTSLLDTFNLGAVFPHLPSPQELFGAEILYHINSLIHVNISLPDVLMTLSK